MKPVRSLIRGAALLYLILFMPSVQAEGVTDLTGGNVTTEGDVARDGSKTAPGGGASFKVGPGSKALIKLRDTDGSGRVSFFVYDDGTVASPDKVKSVGPRWGTTESTGRVFVGSIMYAKFLQPEGSLCLVDTDPREKQAWLPVKFLGPRGVAVWKKWEFFFDSQAGVRVLVDGKAVPEKYFDWKTSKVSGFNGIVLMGDATAGPSAQTIWVGDLSYDLGPPMAVKPGSLPPPAPPALPQPKGPAPEEVTEESSEPPVFGKMAGYVPKPTLLEDLKNLKVPLVEGYDSVHPRLVFSAGDKESLLKRSAENPVLWNAVLASAKGVKSVDSIPTPEVVRSGSKYWRIERVQSAALAWFVTGDREYLDGAVRWMVAHCKEPVWGDTYRPNLDLVASWYLYHIAIAYDILKNEMGEADRKIVRDGLAEHARYIYAHLDPHDTKEKIRYDQNHTYIPTVGMMAAALALLEDVPESKFWLTRAYAVLRRCRYVLSEDGYYYEGYGYWTYALNWHARGAELLERATGEKMFELPALRDTWKFGLHLSLPGMPGAFDVGDSGGWGEDGKRTSSKVTNYAMLWKIASKNGSGPSRTVGDLYAARAQDLDYPATSFLWFDPAVAPKPLEQIEPFHYFPDHGVIAWRSGWDAEATCYLFRCGPPLGHKALEKLGQFSDWIMNCGHVHPDIGAFWMYAKGTYLAVGTGYTSEKWTRDHNTLLVDDKGQGMDGSYHNERGIPYADLAQARINAQFLSKEYGYASGDFGMAYKRLAPGVKLRRSILMTRRWLLLVDDMEASEPRKLSWLCHSDGEFKLEGSAHIARQPKAALAVVSLAPANIVAKPEPTMVMAGTSPVRGKLTQRGFKLVLSAPEPSGKTRFINLLLPLGSGEKMPEVGPVKDENNVVSFALKWPDGKTETVRVDLNWKSGGTAGPANIGIK
jgi:hypothetical protein